MRREAGSFRDPCGQVFIGERDVLRTVTADYAEEWAHLADTGLLSKAVQQGLVLPYEEVDAFALPPGQAKPWKVLRSERLGFVSYPYEWSFSQLKDAALLTLQLHKMALGHDCVLKDASAFNVQFVKGRPIFIDLLSFERWQKGWPWQAYGQFCSHFLAPLALMAKKDLRHGSLSQLWIDGIPLDLACQWLPFSARFSGGLFLHLFLHASMQAKNSDGREAGDKVKKVSLNKRKMLDIADSLMRTVASLSLPKKQQTEWGDYYLDTNYSMAAMESKKRIVAEVADAHSGEAALDLGANTGVFSALLAPHFRIVLAADIDPLAVERHYLSQRAESILPLVFDMVNPSPGIGWQNNERSRFASRCQANLLVALALVHHLVITGGIPLPLVAEGLAELLKDKGCALVEFVPKDDSQVQRLLAAREDIFSNYSEEHFAAAFAGAGFAMLRRFEIVGSARTLYLFRKETA